MIDLANLIFLSSTSGTSDCIFVYDALTGSLLHCYKGPTAASSSLCFTGPDKVVLCGCKDRGLLQAWHINKRQAIGVRLNVPGRVSALAVSPVQPSILVAAIKETLHVYSLESGCRLAVISHHYQAITCLCFTPCGSLFLSGGEDGCVNVWRVQSIISAAFDGSSEAQPHKQLAQHSDKVTQICVNGGRIACASADHSVRVYCQASLQLLHTLVFGCEVRCVALTASATRLAAGTATGHLAVVDLFPVNMKDTIRIQEQEHGARHTGPIQSVSFLPSGNYIVSGGQEDGEVKVWEVNEETSLVTFSSHSNSLDSHMRNLTWKRTIHKGKGPITNLCAKTIERQILVKGWDREQQLADFNTTPIVEATVTISSPQYPADPFVNSSLSHIKRYPSGYEESKMRDYLLKSLI